MKAELTTQDLQTAFGVTGMTIHNWRQGTATKTMLPTVQNGRNVRFSDKAVKAWAKENGLEYNPGGIKPAARPGPKPGQKTAKKSLAATKTGRISSTTKAVSNKPKRGVK